MVQISRHQILRGHHWPDWIPSRKDEVCDYRSKCIPDLSATLGLYRKNCQKQYPSETFHAKRPKITNFLQIYPCYLGKVKVWNTEQGTCLSLGFGS